MYNKIKNKGAEKIGKSIGKLQKLTYLDLSLAFD